MRSSLSSSIVLRSSFSSGVSSRSSRSACGFRVRHAQTERPPSTGTAAPVRPDDCGPANHTSSAATSAGSSRRSTACWEANASASARSYRRADSSRIAVRVGARADRVGADPRAPQLHGQRADRPHDARLGRAVGGQHRQPADGRRRGDGDEATVAGLGAPQQRGNRHASGHQHAVQAGAEHRPLLLHRHLPQRHPAGDHAGTGDERVQPAITALGVADRGRHRLGVDGIGDHGLRARRSCERSRARRAWPSDREAAGHRRRRRRPPPSSRRPSIRRPWPRRSPGPPR